ncbi:hypothetical protein DFQ28_008569 [Apophysomyces sp. BC1034]|nr:hypothetical protein DFQ30_008154 [Apophysomyces sp. BC1015]KAG0175454.1 hypothetical protein DFQ29_007144 [Apophysomyces sp. BC1021]KAG0185913.1 hypothetical protein DFQ28_008569 [Apophysomyces sp. BC1034]
MVLMYLGAYLKDDTAPLTSCGIREGAEVTVFGERPDKEKVKQTASKDSEEYGYLTRIGKITKTLQERVSQVDAFEALANEGKNAQLDEKTVHDEGVFLSESLMQALIALDGISCPPEFETARAQRRAAVKLSQQLLDRVDNSRTILKDLFKSKM